MELLQQVRVIDPNQGIDRLSDVLIEGNMVKQVADRLNDYPAETKILAGQGLVLGTGLVDLYSHSGEPGNEGRETLSNLATGAAAGGFTQVNILPDTLPQIDNASVLAALKQQGRHLASLSEDFAPPRLGFWANASQNNATKQMSELSELKTAAVGFRDRYSLSNLHLFRQVVEYLQPWQKTLAIALDQNELAGDGVVREGADSLRYGIGGSPGFSEAAIIAAVIEIVAEISNPVHIMRVSTKRGVELVAEAKARGIPITASTTWMHLLWNGKAISSYDPNLRLEPPLGSQSDQLALITGVKQGIIDAISIDHQAYTYAEKTVAFALAPPGVIGLEIALPLLWQELVRTKKLTALDLWRSLSSSPLQCLQQQPTAIAPEQGTNLVLFDPNQPWSASRENLCSPAANTPYFNQQLIGKVRKTWNSQ